MHGMLGIQDFTPVASTLGGVMIGLSVSLLMAAGGRIAGISGILGGAIHASPRERSWRLSFIAGLLTGGILLGRVSPALFEASRGVPWWRLIVAGLLVGYGTRLGSGCTSGHGGCGLSRFSVRSLVATLL